MPYDFETDEGRVRLLINDVDQGSPIFEAAEITAFLALEGGSVKLAAAQALDTIADNEALTSKAIRTQDLATDGPKVADSLRKRAAELRAQEAQADEGFFGLVDVAGGGPFNPELTETWPL